MKKFTLLILLLGFFALSAMAVIYSNEIPPKEGESAYDGVESAASRFFLLKAELNNYFSKIEVGDTENAGKHLTTAKQLLNETIVLFQDYKNDLTLTDYQKEKYKNFDYSAFLKASDYHPKYIKKVVARFLSADIKGFFQDIIDNLFNIKECLDDLESNVTNEKLWELFTLISNPTGNYGTIISVEIFKQ